MEAAGQATEKHWARWEPTDITERRWATLDRWWKWQTETDRPTNPNAKRFQALTVAHEGVCRARTGYAARRAALPGTAPHSAGDAELGNKCRDARGAVSKETSTHRVGSHRAVDTTVPRVHSEQPGVAVGRALRRLRLSR